MYKYNFIEHTADIAVDLTASSIEELFIGAGEAWKAVMVDTNDLTEDDKRSITLDAESLEELLVDFLNEINFFFLTQKWFTVSVYNLSISGDNSYRLIADLGGADISNSSLEFREEIKAVTYHQLNIVKEEDNFKTRIVFDI